MPQSNSVIKFPRKGRLGKRGIMEPVFEKHLNICFSNHGALRIFNDRFLMIANQTPPYEPDFSLIDESNDLNLFINIEIDEPYDGIGRFATHYKGQDDHRNQYFNQRGWIIIRFSEKQVRTNPLGCCRLIAEVIKSVNSSFAIPDDLVKVPVVSEEPFWTKFMAEKWANEYYREDYLGIKAFLETTKTLVDTENLFQNHTEQDAEKKVVNSAPEKVQDTSGRVNEINRHQRDSRIQFLPESHTYLIDNNPRAISASTLVKRFFQAFDRDGIANSIAQQQNRTAAAVLQDWDEIGEQAKNLGKQLHHDIESFLNDEKAPHPDKPEFRYFLDFYRTHLVHLKPYRTEWHIFDDLIYVAGTVDMVCKKDDGTYAIYDWKRSKKIETDNPFKKGIGVCDDIPDCKYYHYSLRLNIYKKILEEYYAKPVSEMHIVQLHPNLDTYKTYDVPDLQVTVDRMFNEVLN